MFSLIFLIVITDPYKNIDYEKTNVYIINQDQEIQINNYSPDDDTQEKEPETIFIEPTYYIFR